MGSMVDKLTTKEFKMPESVGYRYIASTGYPTSTNTGQKDLFNIELLNKQKELEKKLEEEARKEEQRKFEENMPTRVDNYTNEVEEEVGRDYDPDKLLKDHDIIMNDLKKIEDTNLRNELETKIVNVWSKYEYEINLKKEEKLAEEKAKKDQKYGEEISSLENKVNSGQINKTDADSQYNKLYNNIISVDNKDLRDDYVYRMNLLKDLINMMPEPTKPNLDNLEYSITNDSGDDSKREDENFNKNEEHEEDSFEQ